MNPIAGPSGPGKFSSRTDLPPSKEYGERKQMEEIQSGAPRSRTRGAADPKLGRPANPMSDITPLYAPSQKPDEPITAGISRGEGPGPEALGVNMPTQKLSDALAKMLPFDTTGEIGILYQEALARGN
jgi:hypothetical protein